VHLMKKTTAVLDDVKIHVKMKISALWVSVVLCYIYGDYFGLYKPGKLEEMLEGRLAVDVGSSTYFLGIVEVALTALIVWYAWNWPKQEAI
jgi:hypothetical protein